MLLADRIAAAAAAASLAGSIATLALGGVAASGSPWPAVLVLALPPVLAGAGAWLAARMMIAASLAPAVEGLERMAARDFSNPAALDPGGGTGRLAEALEACRAALAGQQEAHEREEKEWLAEARERARSQAARQAAVKMHVAVTRLVGAAVGRLSRGDLSARVDVELPQGYSAFRHDFNAAMEALEHAFGETGAAGERLLEHASEIGEAAARLERRAGKLAAHIEADLVAIDADGAEARDVLRMARHTMAGVAIAARRNAEAAERFADLGQSVALEAERLVALAGRFSPAPGDAAPQARDRPPQRLRLPAATVPASVGALALKVGDPPGA